MPGWCEVQVLAAMPYEPTYLVLASTSSASLGTGLHTHTHTHSNTVLRTGMDGMVLGRCAVVCNSETVMAGIVMDTTKKA